VHRGQEEFAVLVTWRAVLTRPARIHVKSLACGYRWHSRIPARVAANEVKTVTKRAPSVAELRRPDARLPISSTSIARLVLVKDGMTAQNRCGPDHSRRRRAPSRD